MRAAAAAWDLVPDPRPDIRSLLEQPQPFHNLLWRSSKGEVFARITLCMISTTHYLPASESACWTGKLDPGLLAHSTL